MDIGYLLALQSLRESLPFAFEQFFATVSFIGEGPALVALALIVYWCVNKRSGEFALLALGLGNFVNQLVKNTVCAYRPWIRDAAVTPAPDAIEGATGYSFPSGHTCGTTASLGSFAWLYRARHRVIAAVCIAVIVLMGFSRNFLGVHTPQDVLVGLLIGIAAIAGIQAFSTWMARCDVERPGHRRDIAVVAVVWAVCAAATVFVTLKPYPHDYVNGVLLVDPNVMKRGSYEAAGLLLGLSLAWLLERRCVGFSTEGLRAGTRVARLALGVVLVGAVFAGSSLLLAGVLPQNAAALCKMLLVSFTGVFVVPWAFSLRERLTGKRVADRR